MTLLQNDLRRRLGTTFAFLGDEIYLRAGRKVPSRAHYGDYPQIEDGVGMVRSFENSFRSLRRRLARRPPQNAEKLNGTILTGELFAPVLEKMLKPFNEQFGARLRVRAVKNNYFGGDITVAGLLTGADFLAARNLVKGEFVIIPSASIKADEDIFLDGMSRADLEQQFTLPVRALDFASLRNLLTSDGDFTIV